MNIHQVDFRESDSQHSSFTFQREARTAGGRGGAPSSRASSPHPAEPHPWSWAGTTELRRFPTASDLGFSAVPRWSPACSNTATPSDKEGTLPSTGQTL